MGVFFKCVDAQMCPERRVVIVGARVDSGDAVTQLRRFSWLEETLVWRLNVGLLLLLCLDSFLFVYPQCTGK